MKVKLVLEPKDIGERSAVGTGVSVKLYFRKGQTTWSEVSRDESELVIVTVSRSDRTVRVH